ncbi:MAG TPA: hypothetical protein VLV78_11440 [Thermoanaerobaculia bacterium]|nr:hypothetical protein [Thermoanaerobaculia bacterium]
MPRCRSLSKPHDPDLSRMLIVFIATGLGFMLLPGTFVGVVSLLKISAAQTSRVADAGWIQAHGHAQVFGWLGTFILGIGYYAIPRLRLSAFSPVAAWTTYGLWTTGVAIRWAVGSWPPALWRVPFALAGALELIAVVIFAASVYLAKPRTRDDSWRNSVILITAAGCGFVAAVAVNAWKSFEVARFGSMPAFDFAFDQRYLVLITWGFVVPFIWGFSSRWIPPLLSLRKTRKALLTPALVVLFSGVVAAMAGALASSAVLLLFAALTFAIALRIFEPATKEPKVRGVHPYTPVLIRIAYGWSIVAAVIAIVSAMRPLPNGYAGAGRHALTVGFFAAAVFTIGPRVLPAFFSVRRLWSTGLMAISLVLLNAGCAIRVVSQILAYEGISATAWKSLPLSAIVEMTAVTLFAVNMLMTLTTGSPLEVHLESLKEREA